MLSIGSLAPDFEIVNQHRQPVRLSSFRGRRHVVLAFHPLAFTPVCSAQVQGFERERPRFEALDAVVLAVSLDANPSKQAWAESLGGISFDLLSDCAPHGAVARSYGVLGADNLAERSIFIVDKAGVVRWARRYDMAEQPDPQAVFDALAAL